MNYLAVLACATALTSAALGLPEDNTNTPVPPPRPAAPSSIGAPHVCMQDYPAAAVAAHQEGTTTIGFTITEAGATTNIHIVKSSGFPLLDDAATSCASNWRYRPAIKDGQPIAVPWKAEVKWVLHGGEGLVVAPKPLPPRSCKKPHGITMPAGAITMLSVLVSTDGKVKDAKVVVSSGNEALDAAATKCAQNWTYEPATRNGAPIEAPSRENFIWNAP